MDRQKPTPCDPLPNPELPGAGPLAISRRELKYPLPRDLWDSAVRLARQYLPAERFDGAHDLVRIRTTYLDSPDLHAYREYVAKSRVRRKVRVRQYAYEGKLDGWCWVEIKSKHYGKGSKRRFRCGVDVLDDVLSGRDVVDHIHKHNQPQKQRQKQGRTDKRQSGRRRQPKPLEAAETYRAVRDLISDGGLAPVARVEFERLSCQDSASSAARLTVDRQIRFLPGARAATESHAYWGGLVRAGRCDGVEFDGSLLEIKYTSVRPSWVGELLGQLNLKRPSRFSKFARAIEAIGADVGLRRDTA